ncbi:hypothetical protein SEA_LILMARTIN_197 [Streptomyces phage LilMartin]|nr:hypothetical protein SEA_LILMARTIN_197 [Streptomyces phage LilMartin]QNO12589.1 hypothetical protein SEA_MULCHMANSION_201 [Streptomyces phage MulchMansion]UVK61257.1 hypothetical protein SEA_ANGELA_200 [Streptomyces phage Angela]
MNNKLTSLAIPAAVAGSLVFGLVACGSEDKPPADFKKACDEVGGKTERDHESLGMSSVAFVTGKGGGGKGGSRSSGSSSSGGGLLDGLFGGGGSDKKSKPSKPKSQSPKVTKPNKGLGLGSDTRKSTPLPKGSTKPHKSSKSHSDDNEWVCMKDGVELFDE